MTSGGLILVGVFMLRYARRPRSPEPDTEPEAGAAADVVPEPESALLPEEEITAEPAGHHCPYCGRALGEDHRFCPECGHDTNNVRRCAECGHQQFVPEDLAAVYCAQCGGLLMGSHRERRENR